MFTVPILPFAAGHAASPAQMAALHLMMHPPARDDGYNDEPMPSEPQYVPSYSAVFSARSSRNSRRRSTWYEPVVPMYSETQLKQIKKRATAYRTQMSKRAYPFAVSAASNKKPLTEAQAAYLLGAPARRAAALARQARNRAPKAYVKGAIAAYGGRQELKYVDTATASYACDTTGSVTCLNLLAVGDDNTTRDGRQVSIKSVQLHGIISQETNTQADSVKARVALVWDNAVNSGAIASVADIFGSATGNSFPKIDNANRFTILWDKSYVFGPYVNTATQAVIDKSCYDIEYYKKINQQTQYSGTTALIGSIQNGALLLVTMGSAGTASPVCSYTSRLRFTDA